jgi:hypothetical protein
MRALQSLLCLLFIIIFAYTIAAASSGAEYPLPLIINEIIGLNWKGLYNLDFSSYLLLTALWICWRHRFTACAWLLAVCSIAGGMLFLAPYLFYQSTKMDGSIEGLLLGRQERL